MAKISSKRPWLIVSPQSAEILHVPECTAVHTSSSITCETLLSATMLTDDESCCSLAPESVFFATSLWTRKKDLRGAIRLPVTPCNENFNVKTLWGKTWEGRETTKRRTTHPPIVINFLQRGIKESVLELAWKRKIPLNNKLIFFDHHYTNEGMEKCRVHGGIKKRGSRSTGAPVHGPTRTHTKRWRCLLSERVFPGGIKSSPDSYGLRQSWE